VGQEVRELCQINRNSWRCR